MTLNRDKLYSILFIACLAGYIWIYYITSNLTNNKYVDVCLIKRATNIPCPSCGSTRSVISLTNGDFIEAFDFNPLGYIVAFIMLIAPVWIFIDVLFKSNSLFRFFQIMENRLKKTKYATILILLIIINWIWNITKGI